MPSAAEVRWLDATQPRQSGVDPEPPTITETDSHAYVDKLIELLGTRAPRWLDNRLAEWRAVDLDFQRNGYPTKRAPKHPLITAIGEYRHWALGTMPSAQVVQLMEAAAAANAFEVDWRGHEAWLAARLRDVNGCRRALFELRTGLYFRALRHSVNTCPHCSSQGLTVGSNAAPQMC